MDENKTLEENKLDMLSVMSILDDLGCTEIDIRYDGSGDSGSIDEVSFMSADQTILTNVLSEIEEFITNLCYNKLMSGLDDWYNNDGGFGTIHIKVPSGEFNIDGHIRVVSENPDGYEGTVQEYAGIEDEEDE